MCFGELCQMRLCETGRVLFGVCYCVFVILCLICAFTLVRVLMRGSVVGAEPFALLVFATFGAPLPSAAIVLVCLFHVCRGLVVPIRFWCAIGAAMPFEIVLLARVLVKLECVGYDSKNLCCSGGDNFWVCL